MQKKLGFIFGGLFVIVAIVNFIDTPVVFCMNVMGNLLLGIAYIESTYFRDLGKKLQILTMLTTSGIMVWTNEPNSLVPVVALIMAVLTADKYFPHKAHLSRYYAMVPLMCSLLLDWKLASIINNLLLYIALTAVLHIIQNDKV